MLNGDSKILAARVADGIAKQKLHVIMVVDTSRSMRGARIGQVNSAISDVHKYLVDLQSENANVDFYISILTFANDAEFLTGYKGVNVNSVSPPKLTAGGYSNLHCAYEELETVLQKESAGGMMPDFGGVAPIILLLTDGHPTKDSEKQLAKLKKLPWFKAALRYGIAIALEDDRTLRVLGDFTDDDSCVVRCLSPGMLANIIRIIVMTASKVKSQGSAVQRQAAAKKPAKRGGAQAKAHVPTQAQNAQVNVKQAIKVTLAEIDNWEW